MKFNYEHEVDDTIERRRDEGVICAINLKAALEKILNEHHYDYSDDDVFVFPDGAMYVTDGPDGSHCRVSVRKY